MHWDNQSVLRCLLLAVCLSSCATGAAAFAQCPQGWTHTSSGGCLLVVQRQAQVVWEDAERLCVAAGGHLASASNGQEWADIVAACATTTNSSCWVGGHQLDNQATPSRGWYWQDCMAQQAAPWDSLVPSVFSWRPMTPGEAYTAEPNDYASLTDYGVERNAENCAKIEDSKDGKGPQLLDYACAPIRDFTPSAYVCSKSTYCSLNGTSVYANSGCQCTCLANFTGDGSICGVCDPNAAPVTQPNGSARCACKAGFVGDGYTCSSSIPSCSANAVPVKNSNGTYICTCQQGFKGPSTNCTKGTDLSTDAQTTSNSTSSTDSSHSGGGVIVAIVVSVGVAALVVACLLAGFLLWKRRKDKWQDSGFFAFVSPKPTPKRWSQSSVRRWSAHSQSSGNIVVVDILNSGVATFTWRELQRATQGFSSATLIGSGGYGDVYKASFANGQVAAVKRAKASLHSGTRELRAEVELLSRLHHAHLVQLKGFCVEKGEQLLVYEYMSNGTLRSHLSSEDPKHCLSWVQRLRIALGAAQGLDYLHNGADPPVIHRDVKSSNILLDDNMVAKVADFGLSKASNAGPYGHLSTIIRGTPGYLDPEYCETQQLSDRSDVYSFGVVLLEIITGRHVMDLTRPEEEWYLIRWARPHLQAGEASLLLDPKIKGEPTEAALNTVAEVTALCLSREGALRPSMSIIVAALGEALDAEEARMQEFEY